MKLLSNDLKHEDLIDRKFTCDGEDFSPHLKWTDYPEETKSFAISCIDIDADLGLWSHWYLYDIPPEINEVDQDGTIHGKTLENDFGNRYYNGPCSGEKHRYVFKVHALNIKTLEKVNNGNFRKIIRSHEIDSAEIMGYYERKVPERIFL